LSLSIILFWDVPALICGTVDFFAGGIQFIHALLLSRTYTFASAGFLVVDVKTEWETECLDRESERNVTRRNAGISSSGLLNIVMCSSSSSSSRRKAAHAFSALAST